VHVSLDQARALDAWARFGTFQRAAEALRKGHTAVLYAVRTLEEQAGIELVDRTGYRSRLTPAGQRVLEQCRKLLATERELESLCAELRGGWEPSLKVVFDGVFPAAPILRVVGELAADKAPTRIEVAVAFLARVEETFERDQADFMITVLPPEGPGLSGVALPEIRARLVAHRKHPAARHHKRSLTPDDLAAYVLVTVQGSDPRLQLATGPLERRSTVRLPDFHAKKAAILQGIGLGWLPEHLILRELERRELVAFELDGRRWHSFEPRLYYRHGQGLGRAGTRVLQALTHAGARQRAK
jgi:DNA-binding transcriptional LysR family regulator